MNEVSVWEAVNVSGRYLVEFWEFSRTVGARYVSQRGTVHMIGDRDVRNAKLKFSPPRLALDEVTAVSWGGAVWACIKALKTTLHGVAWSWISTWKQIAYRVQGKSAP